MAKKIHVPTRMCASCRDKYPQGNLQRLQCLESSLILYSGRGRSFYLCKNCLVDEKKVLKALMRQCRSGDKEKFTNRLKEIITDDRES